MKILRILNRTSVGGPLWNVLHLSVNMGANVSTVLVSGPTGFNEEDASPLLEIHGIRPVIIPEMERSLNIFEDWKGYKLLRKLIRNFKPDIVHTHAAKPGALGRLAARAEGVPVVVHTFHGHVFHSYFNPFKNRIFQGIERYLATKSDAIIAISPEQKKELSEDFRIAPAEKFRVIPLGFDLDKFCQNQLGKRAKFRSDLGVGDDTIVITLTGRLVPIKNHGFFLQAFRELKGLTNTNVLAVFVGDGESRPAIEAEARKLGINYAPIGQQAADTDLIFTSWRTDIDVVNAGSDIIALTSLNEGTPVSLIEALAAEKPVVSTRVGGVESIVHDGVSGYLCDKTDSDAFAKHLSTLVNDSALRQQMGQAGAQYVRTKFTYQRLVKDTYDLYRELLESKKLNNR